MKVMEENFTVPADNYIVKPRIEYDDPHTYYLPQEFFVKALINSPLEFGTVELSRAMADGEYPEHLIDPPQDLRAGWVERRPIDLAMHPQLGVLICGYVEEEEGSELGQELKEELHRLQRDREMLLANLKTNYEMQMLPTPPVGLFIVAPNAKNKAISPKWDLQDAIICTDHHMNRLADHMMSAMAKNHEDHDGELFVDWPRMMAVIQREDYTSALQWLLIYEEI